MDTLVEARKKAEAAVSDMVDPDLKRKAFEVILAHLLNQSAGRTEAPTVEPSSFRKHHRKNEERRPEIPKSATDRILRLQADGFFEAGRGIGEIRDELQAHGWMYQLTAISGPLMKLVRLRSLKRLQSGEGKRKVYRYFNP
jgi:hypothetical protein